MEPLPPYVLEYAVVRWLFLLWIICLGCASNPSTKQIVDLTHSFDTKTPYWPTSPSGFELKSLSHGQTEGGYFYSANIFSAPEHGGTHLDAPIHFAEGAQTVDRIPVDHLVGEGVIIDVRSSCTRDRDYRVTTADLEIWEQAHGPIEPGTIVLIRTGWATRYEDRKAYFGDDTPNDASNLHFPGIAKDAAEALVKRKIHAVGIDTPSIDYGPSADFVAHQVLAAANTPIFENMADSSQIGPRGFTVVALPMKIGGGSGAPLRLIAIVR